jgi:hypothetical protein
LIMVRPRAAIPSNVKPRIILLGLCLPLRYVLDLVPCERKDGSSNQQVARSSRAGRTNHFFPIRRPNRAVTNAMPNNIKAIPTTPARSSIS